MWVNFNLMSKDKENSEIKAKETMLGNCSFKGNRAKPDFEPEEEPATQK